MIHINHIDDKARKFQKIANKLGWHSDTEQILSRLKQLDKGLVQEDEFLYLLNWSNKCRLIHKIDQFIIPPDAKNHFTIPDAFVIFDEEGRSKPYFIEIKTTKEGKLSWTEKYYNGLLNYSKETGIPILIAWKWQQFGWSVLFDIKHFKKNVTNYKIKFEEALLYNLMSPLLKDYWVWFYEEIGFHLKLKKEKLIEQNKNEFTWDVTLDSIYATGKDGKIITNLLPLILTIIFSIPFVEKIKEEEGYIINSFIPEPNKSCFAQTIPIMLSRIFTNDGEVNWINKIKTQDFPISYNELFESFKEGFDNELVSHIIFTTPKEDKIEE